MTHKYEEVVACLKYQLEVLRNRRDLIISDTEDSVILLNRAMHKTRELIEKWSKYENV